MENEQLWDETLLAQALYEYSSRDAKLLARLRNNWRQYKFKMNKKSIGEVTIQISISRHANSNLLSLQRQSKLTNSPIFEHLINDTFQSEMAEQRLQSLRVKEIQLSKQLAKKHSASIENLTNRLSKMKNSAKIKGELTSVLSQVDELTKEKEALIQKLNAAELAFKDQEIELENLKSNLSAEKLISSRLMDELKEPRD